MNSRSGFTLVELAIVIVVIGLVVGGTMVGVDMIRASQLRAVTNEYTMYYNAIQNFRTKYSAIPGDMKNATSFWGDNATYCADAAITDGSPGTCNGNGNGYMDDASAASTTGEEFQFWNQLSYAGFIGGYYSGIAGSAGVIHNVIGTNCPASKFDGGGWGIYYVGGQRTGTANFYTAEYSNYFTFGGQSTNNVPNVALLTPADALSIDRKLDDGMPGTGQIMALWRSTCTNSSSATDYSSTYLTSSKTALCALYFVRLF